jgi:hypothetical protein
MPRLIDADALLDFLDVGHLRHPSELCFSEIDVANLLLHAPTISPDDVRGVGKWIVDSVASNVFRCSICGSDAPVCPTGGNEYKSRYCPSCGARMKGVSEDD